MMFSNCDEQKIYILQNKLWKDEIIKYIRATGKGNVKHNINLIDNNEFIIRIYEPGWNKIEQINASTIKSPNKAVVYLLIKSRDLPFIIQNYKYFIEIEKRYDRNIKNIRFDIKSLYMFLKQMTYCQINLFSRYGIVHNNIHANNIFIESKNEDISYTHINKILKVDVHYILSDFTKCKSYHPCNLTGFEIDEIYKYSLIKNIEDTVKLAFDLLDNSDLHINIDVSDVIKKKYICLANICFEDFEYYKQEYDNFNTNTVNLCFEYIEPILQMIDSFI